MRFVKGRDVSLTATPAVLALQFGSSLPLPLDVRNRLYAQTPRRLPRHRTHQERRIGGKTCASSGIRRQPRSFQPRHADTFKVRVNLVLVRVVVRDAQGRSCPVSRRKPSSSTTTGSSR